MMQVAVSLAAIAASLSASLAFAQTAADADAFIARAEQELLADYIKGNRIYWVNESFITEDTDALAADAGAANTELGARLALEAAKFKEDHALSAWPAAS